MRVTLNLSEKETAAMNELCDLTNLNSMQVLRQALRLYQAVQLGRITTTPAWGGEDVGKQVPPTQE